MNRVDQFGWERVARYDVARRRALWMRVERAESGGNITQLELCAGREGDDAYALLVGDAAQAVHEVLAVAQYGASDALNPPLCDSEGMEVEDGSR